MQGPSGSPARIYRQAVAPNLPGLCFLRRCAVHLYLALQYQIQNKAVRAFQTNQQKEILQQAKLRMAENASRKVKLEQQQQLYFLFN